MKKKTGILLGATLCGLLTFTAGVKAYDGNNAHCYGTPHTMQHHTGWSEETGSLKQNEKALLVQARAEEANAAEAQAVTTSTMEMTNTNPCPYGHENCDGIHNSETNPCPYGYDHCDGTHPHDGTGMHHGTGNVQGRMNGSGHHGGGHH